MCCGENEEGKLQTRHAGTDGFVIAKVGAVCYLHNSVARAVPADDVADTFSICFEELRLAPERDHAFYAIAFWDHLNIFRRGLLDDAEVRDELLFVFVAAQHEISLGGALDDVGLRAQIRIDDLGGHIESHL